MKLKLDENGHVVVQDGKPVYVSDDGKEIAFDAPATVATITRLNGEAKGHREAKEAAEARLKGFEGIEDAEAAKKALETLKNIDEGKLIAAGKVEEIKAAAAKAAQDQVAAQAKAHTEELARVKGELDGVVKEYHGEKVRSAFASSKYIAEKIAIPADIMQARFAESLKVEEGKLAAYDAAGNRIFSRSRPGDPADFDEALEILVDAYPYKDHILKGSGGSGGGTRGGAGSGGAKTITRAEFSKLAPSEQAAKVTNDGFTVVD